MQALAPKPTPPPHARVAVIGGGISGLVAAFDLRHRHPDWDVALYEASERVGGVIQTVRQDGFLLEFGADSFSVQPPGAIQLCRDLGIEDRLVDPLEANRRAFILRAGKLVPVPEGFALLRPTDLKKLLASPLLSIPGRLRLVAEAFVKGKADDADESLQSFALRRFGREAFDRLIQPLVAGIYTADASKLSMQATMPQFVALEAEHGGMVRATRALQKQSKDDAARSASGARYAQFRSLPGGMGELFDTLVDRIGDGNIRRGERIASLCRNGNQWTLQSGQGEAASYDAVIVALPGPAASKLLRPLAAAVADDLAEIPYASSALVLLGVGKDQVAHPLDGFGMVVPAIEQREIIAASFLNRKFADRAPDDMHLIRVFIGGAMQGHLLDRSDEGLIETARRELGDMIGLRGPAKIERVVRWNAAMPQYHVGHCDRRDRIQREISGLPGLELAGNALEGVGIAHCIRTSRTAVDRIVDQVADQARGTSPL
ncbi:Protoporphyrinogen oxidase [Rosistilla carotiformis]|uniref:Coproporphyrinogen III oxidase n=1 Tax=Rosistilla carotiformis TaxID=2528017 RepID=A0A518JNK1_9BACT|nr:protoporphyrinogen oxidase [Rosistilla carotiformis]QDV67117.1 Protoporphyrinogen oxidase [Rosistilla carotiformis]